MSHHSLQVRFHSAVVRRAPHIRPRHRSLRRTLGCLCALLGLAFGLAGDAAGAQVGEGIQITRDIHGVAHVRARTDHAALYGAGWVAGHDRLFQMHRLRRSAQGRLAELVGLVESGPKSTLSQDISFRQRRFYEHHQQLAAQLDDETKGLLEAYCAGVNAAIQQRRFDLPALFAGEVPEPWTPADCLAVWDRVSEFFTNPLPTKEPAQHHAIGTVGSCLLYENLNPTHVVLDEAAAVVQQADFGAQQLEALCDFAAAHGYACGPGGADGGSAHSGSLHSGPPHVTTDEYPKFSNAWVVGGVALSDGSVALCSDPKTRIDVPSIWHELHVTGASFDARGIGIPGCPGFLIGYNRQVAWGMTALGIDLADSYYLTVSDDGSQYLYDGEWRPIESRTEVIRIRTATGFDEVLVDVAWTHIGPVITDLLPGVLPGEEYVLSALPLVDDDRHTVQATLALMSAGNSDELIEAVSDWRVPALHCVYGDVRGQVGYRVVGAIPVRPPDTCLGGVASQDGSTSASAWQGFIPPELLPQEHHAEGGVEFSANHLPVGDWYPIPLLLGTGGSGDGARSWRLRERLASVLDGGVMTPDRVRAVQLDDVNPVRREIVRAGLYLATLAPEQFSPAAHAALAHLGPWLWDGAHSSLDDPAFALAWKLEISFRHAEWPSLVDQWGGNNLTHFLKDVAQRLDALEGPTPGDLPGFSPVEMAFFDRSLTVAWTSTYDDYGTDPREWPQRLADDIGHLEAGYFDTLEGFGSLDPALDVAITGLTHPDNDTLGDQPNLSYSLYARPGAPHESRAVHPLGEVEDPSGPFFAHEALELVAQTLRSSGLSVPPHEVYATEWLTMGSPVAHGRTGR